VKLGLTALALAALLNLGPALSPAALAQQQQPQQPQQPAVPDAPAPQAPPPLMGADGTPITPGKGVGTEPVPSSASSSTSATPPAPSSTAVAPPAKDDFQTTPPEGADALPTFHLNVNFVEVPVTVKDSKGKLVAGLTFRDFKVYENNTREPSGSSPSIPPRFPSPSS